MRTPVGETYKRKAFDDYLLKNYKDNLPYSYLWVFGSDIIILERQFKDLGVNFSHVCFKYKNYNNSHYFIFSEKEDHDIVCVALNKAPAVL